MSDDVNVIERILNRLIRIDDKVNATQIDIVEIKKDLANHIRRTDLAEENIKIVKEDANARLEKLETWSNKFHFVGWLFAGAIGSAEVILRIVDYLKTHV